MPSSGVRSAKMPMSARPSSTACTISLLLRSSSSMRMPLFAWTKRARSGGRNCVVAEVLAHKRTTPMMPRAWSERSAPICSMSPRMRCACCCSARPASVSFTPRECRSSSGTPTALSRSTMRLLAPPIDIRASAAPWLMLPDRTTTQNSDRQTKSMRYSFTAANGRVKPGLCYLCVCWLCRSVRAPQKVRSIFPDHHRRGTDVGARDRRHHRRIGRAQARHAMRAQLRIDDRHRVRARPHARGAVEVVGRDAVAFGEVEQFVVARQPGARQCLAIDIGFERACLQQPARQANAIDQHQAVVLVFQVVRLDEWVRARVPRLEPHMATALRPVLPDACG